MDSVNKNEIYLEANKLLKNLYGQNAQFRDGQYEAIESIFTHRRTLVVQKTGWGKSLIYFISCKLLRDMGKDATIVVSPLLSLMDNQVEAASKLGLKCAVLNSKSAKEEIINKWINNVFDIIFITPETLFSRQVQEYIDELKIGLLVIDEVHCISDYGHDFRLKYMRLKEIIGNLPLTVPILGVTATATNRVIEDIKTQFGNDIYVLRGSLSRESLNIQVIEKNNMCEKYGWILSNINSLPGTGIIYCLTQHDCDELYNFLALNGINCLTYHNGNDELINDIAITKFKNNEIKALIATIKLGMGYDKADVSFIIHLQTPENIVAYYQQIGRAGRNLENAYIFLLGSKIDEKIIDYFIDTSFPKKDDQEKIYKFISDNSGVKKNQIYNNFNIPKQRIDKSLDFLENDEFIFMDNSYYFSTVKTFEYNERHYEEIKNIRRKEKMEMNEFLHTNICYNRFLVNALDDFTAKDCHKCSNCIKEDIYDLNDDTLEIKKAEDYIYNCIHEIIPRKQDENRKKLLYINCIGYALSYYGDYGYGKMVEDDKYNSPKYRDEIKNRCVKVIRNKYLNNINIKYITCVPSNNNKKFENLIKEVALILNLTYVESLKKKDCPNQKNMANSYFQSMNAKENYYVIQDVSNIEKIILADDIVDSRWTLTWCGYYLMENGIEEVYPFTISDSSNRRDNND